jgi:hypothetical protein
MSDISRFFPLVGKEVGNYSLEELIIAVHPYSYEKDIGNSAYSDNIKRLMQNHKFPILIAIPENDIKNYENILNKLKPCGPRIGYLTGSDDYRPVGFTSESYIRISRSKEKRKIFLNELNNVFRPSAIRVVGAELHLDKNGELPEIIYGCVNATYHMLHERFPKKQICIDKKCCWVVRGDE